MAHMTYVRDEQGKDVQIEQDCTFTHEGQEFTSGGAVITDEYITGYMSSDMKRVTNWHGDTITDRVTIRSSWRVLSYITDRMYQVKVFANGRYYTGRTAGGGMIVKLKVCKP